MSSTRTLVVVVLFALFGGVASAQQPRSPAVPLQPAADAPEKGQKFWDVRATAISDLLDVSANTVAMIMWTEHEDSDGVPIFVTGIGSVTVGSVNVGPAQWLVPEEDEAGGFVNSIDEAIVLGGPIIRCFYKNGTPVRSIDITIGFPPSLTYDRFYEVTLENGCADFHPLEVRRGHIPATWQEMEFQGSFPQEDSPAQESLPDSSITVDAPDSGNTIS